MIALLLMLCAALAAGESAESPRVFFQAHRGALDEAPENTMAALRLAWSAPGAVPEVDLRTTAGGVLVCIHDETPERTTDAPESWAKRPIREIPFEKLRAWDAGSHFDARFAGERVPALDEVFAAMKPWQERQLYLDLKAVDTARLVEKIQAAGLEERVIFVHGDVTTCKQLQGLYPGARTMTWLSGPAMLIKTRYRRLKAQDFEGLSQLQLHLHAKRTPDGIEFALEDAFLAKAVAETRAAGVALQLRPFAFDPPSLARLIDMGVDWYVTDAPVKFAECVAAAQKLRAQAADAP